jgi:hypothetical protein
VKESEQSEEGREKGPASSSTNDNNFSDPQRGDIKRCAN